MPEFSLTTYLTLFYKQNGFLFKEDMNQPRKTTVL